MNPLSLGEHGQVSVIRAESRGYYAAYLSYRDWGGRMHRIKRHGQSKAEASRRVMAAVKEALDGDPRRG